MIDYDRYPGEHNGGYPSMEILEPEAIFDDPDNVALLQETDHGNTPIIRKRYDTNPEYLLKKMKSLREALPESDPLAHLGLIAYFARRRVRAVVACIGEYNPVLSASLLGGDRGKQEYINECIQEGWFALVRTMERGVWDPFIGTFSTFESRALRSAITRRAHKDKLISVGAYSEWGLAVASLASQYREGILDESMTSAERAESFEHRGQNTYFTFVPIEDEPDFANRLKRFEALENTARYPYGDVLEHEQTFFAQPGECFATTDVVGEVVDVLAEDVFGEVEHQLVTKQLFDCLLSEIGDKFPRTNRANLRRDLRIFFAYFDIAGNGKYDGEELGTEYRITRQRVHQIISNLSEKIVQLDFMGVDQ